jgi:Cu2+-containing amine oxidase
MAQNHQHLFCVRIDPAIDGYANTIVTEESLPMPMSRALNPFGNGYEVISQQSPSCPSRRMSLTSSRSDKRPSKKQNSLMHRQ